jgi:hypothetical protein
MGKICKSRGHYYRGEYCDKCGYGKPAEVAESVKKYRKAARKKPLRMQTEEDKKLYAKWAKEEKQGQVQKRTDPKAKVHFLIVVVIAALIVLGFALYKSGAVFSNTKEEVIQQYFTAISQGDYDKFVKCFPKEIKREYDDDRQASGLSKEEYMKALYREFTDTYGAGYSITVKFGDMTPLSPDDYDMTAYKEQHGSAPKLSEVCEVVTNIEFRGTKGSQQSKLFIYVGRSGGYWHIFGMDEDMGSINADGSPNEGEIPPVVENEDTIK